MLPRLTPDESKLLATTLAKPVPLKYFFFGDGLVSIEPKTGALIDVHAQQEGVAVQPDLSGVAPLQPLLAKYASIPSVKALSDGLLAQAGRAPQVAQELRYKQTVPSSPGCRRPGALARTADDHRDVVGARRDGSSSGCCCWCSV